MTRGISNLCHMKAFWSFRSGVAVTHYYCDKHLKEKTQSMIAARRNFSATYIERISFIHCDGDTCNE